MSRVADKAAKRFTKVAKLQSMKGPEAVGARKELKRMREVRYYTDKETQPGDFMNPKGKLFAR